MTEHDDTITAQTGPSRRRVAQAAGWSVPLVIAAVGAPAAHASTTPPAGFEGLTGSWSAPIIQDGYTKLIFTVTNTGTSRYRLDAFRVEHSVPSSLNRTIVLVAATGYASASNVSDSPDPAKPPYFASVFPATVGFLELEPSQSFGFTVLVSFTTYRVTLQPMPDPDFSQQLPPFQFPSTTAN
ncbi:hypothetical protein [Rathayibacter sp. VKM Ac-2760]|uniref:hypothetical protein n=1 Tax=Rathayibacter sp. VKM Ac-2760 TaxID=2609253 RepID=UPI001316BEEC|nr:hypothetical protein [Rathayibacter sp. VKM Ac-2760]QHC58698.1 hypothetical protein GSU72_09140 [Rathayibacter sp. VKM Ac-2760]